VDGRSPLELRVKGQFSANQFQALFHAGKSKPSRLRVSDHLNPYFFERTPNGILVH